jgi:hypothetical protein
MGCHFPTLKFREAKIMTDLYELSVGASRRVLESTIAVLEKGATYFEQQGVDLADIIDMRLAPDMNPFSFQVFSVRMSTLGSAKGLLAGEMTGPPETHELSYQGAIKLLTETLAELNTIDAGAIAGAKGKAVLFKAGDFEMPFTAENFVLSFTLPNLYFHAATIYDMLRIKGVPLGKMDFLGNMKMGLPE